MPSERLRLRQIRSTAAFRLTLLLGALFLAGLWATLALGYVLTARELTARSDRILQARASNLAAVAPDVLPRRISAEVSAAPSRLSYFGLLGEDGELVAGNMRLPPGALPDHPFDLPAQPARHGPLRVLAVRTAAGETIVLARDVSQIRDLRHRLLVVLAISGIAGSLSTLAVAVALSLSPLRRVRDFERASRAIAAGDFTVRMPIAGRHDELDQFAGTVNLMVDEIGRVVAQVKTATDAIAHDLRTPLVRARASLARVHHAADLAPTHAAMLDSVVADLDSLAGRFAALLRVSELEASGRRSSLRPVALAPLIVEVAELWAPVAEERDAAMALILDADPIVDADRELLFEAVGNLVDNAIKFGSSSVQVRVLADAGGSRDRGDRRRARHSARRARRGAAALPSCQGRRRRGRDGARPRGRQCHRPPARLLAGAGRRRARARRAHKGRRFLGSMKFL